MADVDVPPPPPNRHERRKREVLARRIAQAAKAALKQRKTRKR